eukprot:TRINITY_DN1918_c0_g1_i1.p3 TRINITY_DN1918_c0_g1~~TRINITY_DN1918_c0_g1_i1.p3  ORF type:complete len:199 (-),score=-24.43 TRINITY_DN1918_c0_g1_i1:441-1037(-)
MTQTIIVLFFTISISILSINLVCFQFILKNFYTICTNKQMLQSYVYYMQQKYKGSFRSYSRLLAIIQTIIIITFAMKFAYYSLLQKTFLAYVHRQIKDKMKVSFRSSKTYDTKTYSEIDLKWEILQHQRALNERFLFYYLVSKYQAYEQMQRIHLCFSYQIQILKSSNIHRYVGRQVNVKVKIKITLEVVCMIRKFIR